MKPVRRYQSQMLFRKSYKPKRVIRIRPVKLSFEFRPVRFGLKPQIKTHDSLSLSCSSRAEPPADNRKTAERYRAGQPDRRAQAPRVAEAD
jgi:hypothetical protein